MELLLKYGCNPNYERIKENKTDTKNTKVEYQSFNKAVEYFDCPTIEQMLKCGAKADAVKIKSEETCFKQTKT